jgi:hypothetical protein
MSGKKQTVSLVQFYQRYRSLLEWAYWPLVWSAQAVLTATSVLMEHQRRGAALDTWEPFVWEFSSVSTSLLGLFLIIQFNQRFPLASDRFFKHLLAHLGFSLVFSAVHVLGMVWIRHWVYIWMGRSYDFGDWSFEMVYEYRKDFMTYASIILTLYVYRYLSSRLISEAVPIEEGDGSTTGAAAERLLVRKLGKEFLLRCDQIEWVEAAGNYMNLHVKGRIYPIRETMVGLLGRLDSKTFVRVHRSHIVNLDQVGQITPLDGGDADIQLHDGTMVRLSRRYRDNLRSLLAG